MKENEEQYIREMIDNLKMDNSIQTETIKEKLKSVVKFAFEKGSFSKEKEVLKILDEEWKIIMDYYAEAKEDKDEDLAKRLDARLFTLEELKQKIKSK